jgi:hypothetical protein
MLRKVAYVVAAIAVMDVALVKASAGAPANDAISAAAPNITASESDQLAGDGAGPRGYRIAAETTKRPPTARPHSPTITRLPASPPVTSPSISRRQASPPRPAVPRNPGPAISRNPSSPPGGPAIVRVPSGAPGHGPAIVRIPRGQPYNGPIVAAPGGYDARPPAQPGVAAIAAAPAVARDGCNVTVFQGRDFTGVNATTSDDFAALNDNWNNAISSIQITAGIWDFFIEVDYEGAAILRLEPGDYAYVGDAWNDNISSFKCIQAAAFGRCEVTVFQGRDFTGENATTSNNHPDLNDDWDNAISSIQIRSGIWDFFVEADYEGDRLLRLEPGQYAYVGDDWNDNISSFKCVEH